MAGDRPRNGTGSATAVGFLRGQTLAGRLILFGTLVTLVTVALSLLALSAVIRRQTRTHLVELLAQNQSSARDLQERSLRELLWMSSLVSQSPTLRAALDTYRSESTMANEHRGDLLATVAVEVRRIREMVGKDVAIVTDEQGTVLAADPPSASLPRPGAALSDRAWIRDVLDAGNDAVHPAFGVLEAGAARAHVGCVPILLQGFVIGTLTLGDTIDQGWLARLQEALRSDVAVVVDGGIALSTVQHGPLQPELARRLRETPQVETRSAELTRIDREEYLVVPIALGTDDRGRPASLLLLQSLTRALGPVQESLLMALLLTGAITVVLAGAAAWRISGSILDPLERFVAFVRSIAASRDASRRFEGDGLTTEIRYLNEAFSDLLTALQAREQQILDAQREELIRVERLKESEKLAALGRMLSSAAHEINNPLTAVLGQVDLALAAGPMEDRTRERLLSARKEGNRISALVKTLLKVAHKDTGERSMVDLHHLLRETIALRQHEYNSAGVKLTLEPCSAAVTIRANELELQQVFLNIINNALDVLRDVKTAPALTIRTRAEGGNITITLSDNGPGMVDPRRVFDHFYTTKPVGKGTGLGLSISHAVVTGHGGSIAARNNPDGGACFTITLPMHARARSTAEAPPAVAAGTSPLQLASALVVDDEPSVLEYQMEILRSLGVAPVAARSGDEAMACIGRQQFEVIVSDLRMPGGMSGPDLFAWVEKHHPDLAARFVFVTGDTVSETTREFLKHSGRPYLMKPFDVKEYVDALRAAKPAQPIS